MALVDVEKQNAQGDDASRKVFYRLSSLVRVSPLTLLTKEGEAEVDCLSRLAVSMLLAPRGRKRVPQALLVALVTPKRPRSSVRQLDLG